MKSVLKYFRDLEIKCLFCDVEMLWGYLQCGIAIWSTKKHKISLNPNMQAAGSLIDSSDYKNNIE